MSRTMRQANAAGLLARRRRVPECTPLFMRMMTWTRGSNARREGTLWQRRMRTLALRLPKGRPRLDRSGAPMKRG